MARASLVSKEGCVCGGGWGGGGWEQESINKIYTKRTRMRILIPWRTDRLSSQSTGLVAQVCQSPNPPGLQSSRDFAPFPGGGKLAFTGASENHFSHLVERKNLVGSQPSRPRIPHPCRSPFFYFIFFFL